MKKTTLHKMSLFAGVTALAIMTGCSSTSQNKPAGPVPGSTGLLGTRELVPPPYASPSNLRQVPLTPISETGKPAPAAVDTVNFDEPAAGLKPIAAGAPKGNEAFVPAAPAATDVEASPVIVSLNPNDAAKGAAVETVDAAAVPDQPIYYVKQGDVLGSIARKHGVRWQDIATLNNKSNADTIRVGEKLLLPAGAKTFPEDTIAPAKPAVTKAATATATAPKATTAAPATNRKPIPADGKYRVASGDSLWLVGHKFGIPTSDIKRWNNLKSDVLRPGQELTLRGDAAPASAATDAAPKATKKAAAAAPAAVSADGKYYVVNGDHLTKVSKKTGVSIAELRRINNLKSDNLHIGQCLLTRDNGAAPAAPAAAAPDPAVAPVVDAAAPAGEAPAAAASAAPVAPKVTQYTLVDGDTFDSVMKMFGIQEDALLQMNPGKTREQFVPGTVINVPDVTVGAIE